MLHSDNLIAPILHHDFFSKPGNARQQNVKAGSIIGIDVNVDQLPQ
jgi:hypothetical protein